MLCPPNIAGQSFIGVYLWAQCPSFFPAPLNIEIQTKEETSEELRRLPKDIINKAQNLIQYVEAQTILEAAGQMDLLCKTT